MKRWWTTMIGALAVAVACVGSTAPALGAQTSAPDAREGVSVVWVVRHAERADAGMADQPDPELSSIGHRRASELARLLSDAGITEIYSTPYRRTEQTAAPLAVARGLDVVTYDPRDTAAMATFLDRLRQPGRRLVVGHSNTTPALVRQLGGDPVSPIDETEYDRIYVVTRGPDGSVTSSLLRFGAPAPGN